MSKIVWDKTGERFYETGVDHAVLYPISAAGLYNKGVPWNGITAITESPSGAEPNNLYADNIKYLVLVGAEDFGLTIEAYTYPDEWEECDGSAEIAPGVIAGQQNRKVFGLSYRTKLGNDVDGQDHGYKLHLVYRMPHDDLGRRTYRLRHDRAPTRRAGILRHARRAGRAHTYQRPRDRGARNGAARKV